MSAGAVIRYAMTLDGAQYMQELRRSIAETKAAEQAMKAEAKAMGVVSVSGDDVRKALASASGQTTILSGGMSGAMSITKGFNAAQSALAQAMGGNFVGAAKSATAATRSFNAALSANPALLIAGLISGAALAIKSVVDRMNEYKASMASIRAEHEAFARSIAEMEGTDPTSVTNRAIDEASGSGLSGRNDVRNIRQEIDSQVAVKKQELVETEDALRAAQASAAKVASVWGATWIGGDMFGKRAEQLKGEIEVKTKEYKDLLALQNRAKEAEGSIVDDSGAAALSERDRKQKIQFEKDALAAAKTDKDRQAIRERLALEEAARRRKEEDSAGSELEKLEVRKKNISGDYLRAASSGTEQGNLEARKKLDEIEVVEKEIAAVKAASAEKSAEEGKQRLADAAKLALIEAGGAQGKAQGRLDAAKADIMNPGDAKRAEREAEKEKRKEELREKARMTGNSEEAKARRAELALAKEGLKQANGAVAQAETAVSMAKTESLLGSINTGINQIQKQLS